MALRKPARGQVEGAVLLIVGVGLFVAAGATALGAVRWAGLFALLRSWGLVAGFLLVALACLVAGGRGVARGHAADDDRAPLRPIRWWAITAAVAVVLAATWIGVTWLVQATQPTDPSSRLDAIRTGLSIGAGTAAAIALLFTARRQWLSERTQAHAELDTTERRVSDIYAKAAEQFGTDKDLVVRLAGLYALERLAQQYPEYRATVVDVFCAYLCTANPDAGGGLGPRRSQRGAVQNSARRPDIQVRHATLAVLVDHLRPGSNRRGVDPKFWPDIDLDLAGATLTDSDFSRCRIRVGRFAGTRFMGSATFEYAHFTEADFSDAGFFGGARFDAVRFSGPAQFRRARMTGDVRFFGAVSTEDVAFHGAVINGAAYTGWVRFDEQGLAIGNRS